MVKRKSTFLSPKKMPPLNVLPTEVRLDASTLCQLDCVSCYMRKENYAAHGAGYLKYSDFVNFLDKNPYVKEIELSNSGEIFLNKDLLKIIEYAYQHDVILYADGGVNFNHVSDEILESLVKYQFRGVVVAIDGASQEIYSKYRRKGNFDAVIDNIKKLNEYKKKYNSEFPLLGWKYVIMETNDFETEIQSAITTAASLNVSIVFRKSWDGYITKNEEILKRDDYQTVINKDGSEQMPCIDFFERPQINWDGRLFGCCVNCWKDFNVNVFDIGLEKALNTEIVIQSKKMLMGQGVCKDSPCYQCGLYRNMAHIHNDKLGYWIRLRRKLIPEKIRKKALKILHK
ncbi:MAG: hypothetical protein LBI82_08050 [Dysgonamonadaceae bacterium]|jgi:sulfatase maturation enzyme AslB (radical SAM superfamily)|nr:hypothetical protein [Dysgonamonadaceae bacterium]